MAEAQLQQFLAKVQALNAFVALSEADPAVRQALAACSTHHEVVTLARSFGLEIGRRWGETQSSAGAADNLLASALPPPGEEQTAIVLETSSWRLLRIHSNQAASADGCWDDQDEHEWVLLLQGSALLQFDDEPEARALSRGDQLLIPAHRRHRLLATDPDPGTVWLALFWRADAVG
ncbi:MAG: Nif11 domain/cupin domain-containing protein [Cyanobacteria bacterium K_DeepCast_35m_m2_023]|nr:Nif11 domain/cupin domain-containing protein [Cyanobacteria bacterium K_DeepCast_35m_m2_023]